MNFKILYVFLAILAVIALFSLLVAREVAIIQPKFQGNNTQEIASQEEHEEYLPYDFSSASPVEKRFSITVIKRLPREKPLPSAAKQKIKETPQAERSEPAEQTEIHSNQTAVTLDKDSKKPDFDDDAGGGLPLKEMKKRGIIMF